MTPASFYRLRILLRSSCSWLLGLTLMASLMPSLASAQESCDVVLKPTAEQEEIAALLLELRATPHEKNYYKTIEEHLYTFAEQGRKGRFVSRYLHFVTFDKANELAGGPGGIVPDSVLADFLAAYERGQQVGVAVAHDLYSATGDGNSDRWTDISINTMSDRLAEGFPEDIAGHNPAEEIRSTFESMVELDTQIDVMFDVLGLLDSMDQMLQDIINNILVGGWDWQDFGESVVSGAAAGGIAGGVAGGPAGAAAGAATGAVMGAAGYVLRQGWHGFLDACDLRHNDHDNDGIPNYLDSDYPVSDSDWDGDGVPNERDRRPHNSNKSIAPWSEPPFQFITGGIHSSLTTDGNYDMETYNPESGFLSMVADFANFSHYDFMAQDLAFQP